MKKYNQSAPKVEPGVHLNLGCGAKVWEGFVNIDFPSNWCNIEPDIACDLRKIDLPDEYADSAYAIHVIEHFYPWDVYGVLTEWKRLLKPGGQLILELPCLDKIIQLFNYYIQNNIPLNHTMTMWGLYGDPSHESEAMMHHWCFSRNMMRFVIIIGGVAHDFMPNAWGTYSPTIIEYGVLVGSFSLFFFLFLLFVKHLPSVSMTEMKESVHKGEGNVV